MLNLSQAPSTSQGLESVLREIASVVGQAHVFSSPEEVEVRSQDLIPFPQKPSAFVYPGSVEEIQGILAIANRYAIALWPCSQGKNWGYGAATPALKGGIVLVLQRLNRILHVDPDLAFAVVEPGVTYRQLHRHLREQRLPVWLDCTDGPADASVMGNALERGVGETPYGDHFGNICGMEVLLPTGELLRTGGGPFEGFRSWNTYKWGVGPYLEGLFSQSNLGIVTKIGMWLMPAPEGYLSYTFELDKEEDFPAALDALRRLSLNGAVSSKVHMINDVVSLAVIAEHPRALLQDAPTLSDERRGELRRRYNLTPWVFAGGLYGTPAQVRAHKALLVAELSPYGRLRFLGNRRVDFLKRLLSATARAGEGSLGRALGRAFCRSVLGKPLELVEMLTHVHAIERGEPSDYFVKHAYYKSRHPKPGQGQSVDPARDRCGLIWLGLMVPLRGAVVGDVLAVCEGLYRDHGFDFSVALLLANPRTVIVLVSIFFDRDDPDETRRAHALYLAIGSRTQELGYQQYRTSTAYMDRILAPAPEFLALAEKLKAAVDPRGILAPGKYGIGASRKEPGPIS